MQELPLPPLGNRYGVAQRALAKKYGAALVPKWCLAWVLAKEGATVDGLHLSERGNRSLARRFGSVLGPPKRATTSQGA
jgi:acyl-CoA thioesterase-1